MKTYHKLVTCLSWVLCITSEKCISLMLVLNKKWHTYKHLHSIFSTIQNNSRYKMSLTDIWFHNIIIDQRQIDRHHSLKSGDIPNNIYIRNYIIKNHKKCCLKTTKGRQEHHIQKTYLELPNPQEYWIKPHPMVIWYQTPVAKFFVSMAPYQWPS